MPDMRLSKWLMFVGALVTVVLINCAMMMVFVRHVDADQRIVVVTAPPSPAPTRPYDDSLWALPSPEPEPSSEPSDHVAFPLPKRAVSEAPGQRKPFYLVASPESNGNRFLVKLLLSAGCYGQSGHRQPFDEPARSNSQVPWPNRIRDPRLWPPGHEEAPCAVMHRSVPHARVWPDLPALVRRIEEVGYEPRILVSWRPEDVARSSQVMQKHVKTLEQAEDHILRAQRHIVRAVAGLDGTWVRFVLYEQLGHDHYLDWLFREQMGLTLPPAHPAFEDRDAKHLHGAGSFA